MSALVGSQRLTYVQVLHLLRKGLDIDLDHCRQNCIKRDLSSSCTYVHAEIRREKAAPIPKSNAGSNSRDEQSQISHLEELVVLLMNKTKAKNVQPSSNGLQHLLDPTKTLDEQGTDIENINETEESLGRMNIEDERLSYVESTHWMAILDNIASLKHKLEAFEPMIEAKSRGPESEGPDLLVGGYRKATMSEILACLPSRPIVDLLVDAYFSTTDMGSTMLHAPTFRKEYEQFWKEPAKTPIMWIGLLYAISTQMTHFHLMSGGNAFEKFQDIALRSPNELMSVLREKTVQCLILGNYTKPGPYTIETLIIYYVTEHFRSPDTQFGGWLIFGIIIRAAMRLGLHRDASHYPKISVFQGEMQRRTWASIVHLDLLTSLQVGLPRMIKDGMSDTEAPRRLLDEDFDENVKILPPPRPEGDLIPIGYSNIKHRITKVFGTIVDQANSTCLISYDAVLNLDKRLHAMHQETPAPLKLRSIDELYDDNPETRQRKFSIDLTFQKARCILHRKFFVLSKETGTYPYPYSAKSCIEAAMRILECQICMDRETRPGGAMHQHRWKASSLVRHDFLLAAMLICIYLGHELSPERKHRNSQSDPHVQWAPEDMFQTLKNSHHIFEQLGGSSKEASKAANAMSGMLANVRASGFAPSANEPRKESSLSVSDGSNAAASEIILDVQEAPPVQRQNFAGLWLRTGTFSSQNGEEDSNMTSANDGEPENLLELDWESWDNQFHLNSTPPNLWDLDMCAGPDSSTVLMQSWEHPQL